jgi:hypothetical protein
MVFVKEMKKYDIHCHGASYIRIPTFPEMTVSELKDAFASVSVFGVP